MDVPADMPDGDPAQRWDDVLPATRVVSTARGISLIALWHDGGPSDSGVPALLGTRRHGAAVVYELRSPIVGDAAATGRNGGER